jgi:hypothetical protein
MSQGGPNNVAGSGGSPVETLTGNSGGAVSPDAAFNIDIVGNNAVGIDIVGTPGSNLLTILGLAASETQVGTVELATSAETTTGTSTSLAVHPAGLNAKLGTQTSNGLIYGQGGAGTNLGVLAEATNGQLPIGSTGNPPVLSTLTAGAASLITNGAGSITIDASTNFETTGMHGWNGAILETPAVTVTSDGATITCSVQKSGGGNLTVVFSDGFFPWTTPPDTISLTAGSDTSPTLNYVYFLRTTKTLMVSTVSWPAAEHAPIATVLCQSAASLQTDGAYKVHAWTDHVVRTDQQGHISMLNLWVRNQNATWESGVSQTYTITPNGGAADNVILTTASGMVLQLHPHVFPAFGGTPDVYVVNDFTTPYTKVTDLNALLTDSTNTSMAGRYFSLVIWGVVSEDTGDCKLYCNLPGGSYNNASGVESDLSNFANYTIPSDFKGTGFLISEWKLRHQAAASGTWTSIDEIDLRGLIPAITAGGGTAPSSEFVDNAFRILDDVDNTKEIAFEASSITTGNTRTLTVQDSDGTIALTSDFSTALALGNTVANTVEATNLTVDPAAASDSYAQFSESTTGKWRIGNDETDDSFRISQGSALGTNDTFVMSSAGERTMPLQPAFLAVLGSDDLNQTGDGTVFILGDTDVGTALTEIYDQNGDLTAGSSSGAVFTAPVTGRYHFEILVQITDIAAAHTTSQLRLITSNRTYDFANLSPGAAKSNGNTYTLHGSTYADMDAADTATVTIAVFGGAKQIDITGTAGGVEFTTFSGCLIC